MAIKDPNFLHIFCLNCKVGLGLLVVSGYVCHCKDFLNPKVRVLYRDNIYTVLSLTNTGEIISGGLDVESTSNFRKTGEL